MLVRVAKVDRPMGRASVVDSNNGPCPPEYGEPVTYFKGYLIRSTHLKMNGCDSLGISWPKQRPGLASPLRVVVFLTGILPKQCLVSFG